MRNDFEKRSIPDMGQKLSHLEGILGAYLPQRVFDSDVQQKEIDCNKFAFSRLRSGQRRAANWELGRFIELFELAKFGFDYRVFFGSFEQFEADLQRAGVGSYGTPVAQRLREALRAEVSPKAEITVRRDKLLNVGGIGGFEEDAGVLCLTKRDNVTLTVPLKPVNSGQDYLLLLHDFPSDRATSCLMPSVFAPEYEVSGTSIRLPMHTSGYLSFPVNGEGGYRCLYGIQSSTNLASFIGLENADEGVLDIHSHQIALLVDYLVNAAPEERAKTHVSFGEYLLKDHGT
jgi:hypothetical protein